MCVFSCFFIFRKKIEVSRVQILKWFMLIEVFKVFGKDKVFEYVFRCVRAGCELYFSGFVPFEVQNM